MNKIKQAFYGATVTALATTPLVAGAALSLPSSNGFNVNKATNADTGLTNTTVYNLISVFMNWLLGIIGVLAVIAFVVSGILYLTAAGDEGRIEQAKATMMYAIIGLVVALIGLIIVNAIAGLTGATGGSTY
ncbi:MAG: hypothetical protein CO143_00100 [Candidatus Moranbacteria bacterium CG_4_9_14_3_um_filter_45_14]|nr:MAG: hypothetical protein AUK19_01070 [Candidatus Moranbacteria bacterium CG2_30_45_14]PJA86037.1 MAG: hypothetical protein CO143_00100 [Candidatus Moranbacteria bacterium CG_4_9_14_3_um_filter_45_14]